MSGVSGQERLNTRKSIQRVSLPGTNRIWHIHNMYALVVTRAVNDIVAKYSPDVDLYA